MPEEKLPWEDSEFDEEKAKRLVLNLRSEIAELKSKAADLRDKNSELREKAEKDNGNKRLQQQLAEAREENINLKLEIATPLTASQIARLRGKTYEERLEDAKKFAEEIGQPFDLDDDEDAGGTQEEDLSGGNNSGQGDEGQIPPPVDRNWRSPLTPPGQKNDTEDVSKLAEGVTLGGL